MTTAPESTNTAATESPKAFGPTSDGPDTSQFRPSVVCNVTDGSTFSPSSGRSTIPVLVAFGGDRLHAYRLAGSWNLPKAAAENANMLYRSYRRTQFKGDAVEWDDLTFQFGPKLFVYADNTWVVGYADSIAEAERVAKQFAKAYSLPDPPPTGQYYLIRTEPSKIECHKVSLPTGNVLSSENLSLHYGAASQPWHDNLVANLRTKNRGLVILEGSPGTGKTFYIRHLMEVLKESHRFYFVPPQNLSVLSRPDFVGFWVEQRERHNERQFAVILEDADAALMTRGNDNREDVSSVLNLSDGLLGDFLRLQIICTINCSSADIDQALLRPGRLISHRNFPRLNHSEAAQLAESLGKTLPEPRDYSLAEVFAGGGSSESNRSRIGFAA